MNCKREGSGARRRGRGMGGAMVEAIEVGLHAIQSLLDPDRKVRKVVAGFHKTGEIHQAFPEKGSRPWGTWVKHKDAILAWAKEAAILDDPLHDMSFDEQERVAVGCMVICAMARDSDALLPEMHALYQIAFHSRFLLAEEYADDEYPHFLKAIYSKPSEILAHLQSNDFGQMAASEKAILLRVMAELDNPQRPNNDCLTHLHHINHYQDRENRFYAHQALRHYFDQRLPALNFKSSAGNACVTVDQNGTYYCYCAGRSYRIQKHKESERRTQVKASLICNDENEFFHHRRLNTQQITGSIIPDTSVLPAHVGAVIDLILRASDDMDLFDGDNRHFYAGDK